MEKTNIPTIKELTDYIKINEKTESLLKQDKGYAEFISSRQWRLGLASMDHHLQKKLLESSDEDLDVLIKSDDHPLPLSRTVDETLMDLDFEANSRNKALSKLAKLASTVKCGASYEELYLELERRETISSTAIGQGVAIPHSRFPHQLLYNQPKLVIARSVRGVDFGAPDNKKVHLFLMPCAPNSFIHLRMIAQIVKLLHIPNVIERFKNTTKKKDVRLIIRAFEQLKVL